MEEIITPSILRLLQSNSLEDNYLGLNLVYGKVGSRRKVFETICNHTSNIGMKYYSMGYKEYIDGYTMKAEYQNAFI